MYGFKLKDKLLSRSYEFNSMTDVWTFDGDLYTLHVDSSSCTLIWIGSEDGLTPNNNYYY